MDYSKYFWQGKKIRLRPVNAEDAEKVYEANLDTPSRQLLQLGVELPSSVELSREFLAKYSGCKNVDGVIIMAVEAPSGEFAGGLSLHTMSPKNGTFSLGIIINAPHRKKGYAEDAVRLLLKYCFHERRFQKCNSACIATNEASIALHKALGFVEEGRRRRNIFFNGRYYDDVLFGLTREEFEALEEA